eukprot:6491441-Amphidinium_carterae.1
MGSSNRPISCCKGGALCTLGAGGGNLLRWRASALPASLCSSCCECEWSDRCRCPGSLLGNKAGAASRGGEVPSTCASCRAESAGAALWMRSLVRLAWRCKRAKLGTIAGCCGDSCSACNVAVHSEAGKKEAPSAGGGCCIAELTCPCVQRIKQASAEQSWLTLYCSRQHGHCGVLLRHEDDGYNCQQEVLVLVEGIAVQQRRLRQKLEQGLELELELGLELELELGAWTADLLCVLHDGVHTPRGCGASGQGLKLQCASLGGAAACKVAK